MAVNPVYDQLFDGFAPEAYRNSPHARQQWAVLEWECALKHPNDGAREGTMFIRDHIIQVTDKAFDDFAASVSYDALNNKVLCIQLCPCC